jgi:hypothetical protein
VLFDQALSFLATRVDADATKQCLMCGGKSCSTHSAMVVDRLKSARAELLVHVTTLSTRHLQRRYERRLARSRTWCDDCGDGRCRNCRLRRLRHQHPKCEHCEHAFDQEETFRVVSGERDSWRYKKAHTHSLCLSQSNFNFVCYLTNTSLLLQDPSAGLGLHRDCNAVVNS